jgi:hypothetical protein
MLGTHHLRPTNFTTWIQMTDRPTQIERAFLIAASGTVTTIRELKLKLRSEGYPEEGHLYGRAITMQLVILMGEANSRSDA